MTKKIDFSEYDAVIRRPGYKITDDKSKELYEAWGALCKVNELRDQLIDLQPFLFKKMREMYYFDYALENLEKFRENFEVDVDIYGDSINEGTKNYE